MEDEASTIRAVARTVDVRTVHPRSARSPRRVVTNLRARIFHARNLRSAAGQHAGRRRFLIYCVASLVPVLAIGLVIGRIAGDQLRSQGLAQARAAGSQIDQMIVALVGPDSSVHLSSPQITALENQMKQLTATHQFYGVRLYAANNTKLFDTGGPFAPIPLSGHDLDEVFAGRILTTVLVVPHSTDQVVEVSELKTPGRPSDGYISIYLPFDQVQAELATELHRIDIGLALGLAILFLVLFLINQSTTRGLRREAQANATLARTDALTDLPNRRALGEHVRRMLEPPNSGKPFALVVMDLDQFKHVNDNLGHRIGDRLLLEVAHRLGACMRPQDFVARLGGDEFALVLSGTADREVVAGLIERVRAGLRTDVEYEGIPLSVEGSFGVATHPRDGTEADLLLQRADTAMYRAKATETSVQFYDEVVDVSKPEWLTLAGQLRHAVGAGELRLFYQPKISLNTGHLTGAEALLRWEHPTRGLISPDEFLGIAERTGTIREITAWVLDEALAQLARWDEATLVPRMAVNISTKSLRYEDALPGTVAELLRRHQIDPERLTLEITETALTADDVAARAVLGMLDNLGVRISVDDFGKGFTGIGYLKDMPVSELKIDKDFVVRMLDDRADHAIVRSVVDLAHRLDLECTAEGIETAELFEELLNIGCERGQGFYVAVPLSGAEFGVWMQANRSGTDRVRFDPSGAAGPRADHVARHS